MPGELVHPSFLNLMRSLKPYVGRTMLQYMELVEDLIELLATEQAQKVQNSFLSLREKKAEQATIPDSPMDEEEEDLNKSLQKENINKHESISAGEKLYGRKPYILFLILILLVLSFD